MQFLRLQRIYHGLRSGPATTSKRAELPLLLYEKGLCTLLARAHFQVPVPLSLPQDEAFDHTPALEYGSLARNLL